METNIMKKLIWFGIFTTFMFVMVTMALVNIARADGPSPAGTWRIVYDGKDEVVYKLWVQNDTLFGKISRMNLKSVNESNPVCTKCKGANKDKPIQGLTILTGLTKNDKGEWSGGKILDPESGKYFKCKISLKDGGNKLVLKGYAGIFSSTETWSRVN